jgi:uncharacterized iron-regulated membrane protein
MFKAPAFRFGWRELHLWASTVLAIPLLFVIVTGMLLQVRQLPGFEWIQPATANGSARDEPTLDHQRLLEAARSVPEMRVSAWADIQRLDLRPRNGSIKVLSATATHEIQVDAKTGAILASLPRRSDWFESLHDWTFMGARLWLGVPVAIVYLGLSITGIVLAYRVIKRMIAEAKAGYKPPRKPGFTEWCWRHHWWISLVVLLPWTLVAVTGVGLQLRDELKFVQAERNVSAQPGVIPTQSWTHVLAAASAVADTSKVTRWRDVRRIYFHTDRAVFEVMSRNDPPWETQVDGHTGQVLSVTYRTKDIWEQLHEGNLEIIGVDAFQVHYWVFIPAHLISIVLWVTGLMMGIRQFIAAPTPQPQTRLAE